VACVSRIYSDLATLSCSVNGLTLMDIVDGLTVDELSQRIGLPIQA
jgi:3-oxoadipate CoA-transferase beta subunit